MVTTQDAKIEAAVMAEEIKELRELREVKILLDAVYRNNPANLRSYVPSLEKAARFLLDAKTRNDKIAAFSTRLEKDFLSYRKGGSKEKYLTTEEARILTTTRNIATHLKSVFQAVEQAIHFAKQSDVVTVTGMQADKTSREILARAMIELNNLISAVQQLYVLERQLDVALER